MPTVSIIVPVHNAEYCLSRCIDSILAQTFVDIECILIDDGSTDTSSILCKKYTEADTRVRYYYQNNSGPAAARCNGVNKSESNMVMFVDADDWLEYNAAEILYADYKKTNADMILTTTVNLIYDGNFYIRRYRPIKNMQSPLVYYFTNSFRGNWNKLMNKKLWEKIYIPEKTEFEDYITSVQIFSKISKDKISCIDVPIYNYVRDSSRETLSYIESDAFNKPFGEMKQLEIFKWIKTYLFSLQLKEHDREQINGAYSLLFVQSLVCPYLARSQYVTKEETKIFWEHYKKSMTVGKHPLQWSIFINIFCRSLTLGKALQIVYRALYRYRSTRVWLWLRETFRLMTRR